MQLVQKCLQLLGLKVLSVNSPSNDSEKKWALKVFKCFKLIQTLEGKIATDLPLFADILMPIAESFAVKYNLKAPTRDLDNETVFNIQVNEANSTAKVDVVSVENIRVPSRR